MTVEMRLTRRSLMATSAVLGLFAATRAFAANYGAATQIVNTSNGPVRGRFEESGVQAFKGLRYAAPPIGTLRFRPPQPLEHWTEVVDAAEFGNAAIQTLGQGDAPFDERYSEDCLFLNVWTNDLSGKKPVMVWFHGGAFSSGAAGRPTYWGDEFAKNGVVLVSINHRLNVFGFTQLPEEWGDDYRSSGIAGILDLVAALEWVQANIALFGGDPDNVTIFGESGGGAKVSMLLGMPSARPLYSKAIIQSGAALDATPRPYAQALGGALIDELGIAPGDVAALARVDAQRIFASQESAVEAVQRLAPEGFLIGGFVPSIDGKLLPRGPFTPEAHSMIADVPMIIGTNKDEGTMFSSVPPETTDAELLQRANEAFPGKGSEMVAALRASYPDYSPGELITAMVGNQMFWRDSIIMAERKVRQSAPVWMYRMDWETPAFGGRLKAGHAVELSFVFATFENIRPFVGPGPDPARMAEQMHSAWVAFAKNGNPQDQAIPHWPEYNLETRSTMIFNLESRVEQDPWDSLRDLMVR